MSEDFEDYTRDELIMYISDIEKDNESLHDWVNDLQSGMYINCIYCGYQYGHKSKVPASMADILKEHIEKCPMHPMSKLKADLEAANKTIEGLRSRLKGIERVIEKWNIGRKPLSHGQICHDMYEAISGDSIKEAEEKDA